MLQPNMLMSLLNRTRENPRFIGRSGISSVACQGIQRKSLARARSETDHVALDPECGARAYIPLPDAYWNARPALPVQTRVAMRVQNLSIGQV
ncbi:hypothetical protein LA080_012986 [Diaporthe eres]|nr:hypothetical protein LA080_012986 [Diaporthe eres]